ncbi:22256_t:CDS:1 [Dentiscutata erythropus]|uniref:22256_t:CDS:1 n=1 Tax=Dentiscutata erythropus TaxID=1348616 RepID=A0A9N9E4S2_9GLOM|nr:22256_t:CDS:1 [Dentiscutata erythropus]
MEKGKKRTSIPVKRKKPNLSSPEPSSEEDDHLTRLCSIRLRRYINISNQFEVKIFNINNHNHTLKITDDRDNILAALQNQYSCYVSVLLIRINNHNNHEIRFWYNDRYVALRHTDINLDTERYSVGYVGIDANGRLNLRIVNNGNNRTINKFS